MNNLLDLIRTHVLVHWRATGGATVLSLLVTALITVPLAIFAAIFYVLLKRNGGESAPAADLGDGSAIPRGFDIGAWNNVLTAKLDSSLVALGEVKFIAVAGAIYLLAILCTKFLELAMTYFIWRLRCVVGRDMTKSLFHHICNLSLDFFNRSRTGDLVSRMTNGYDTVIGDRGLRISGGQEPARHDPVGMISSKDVINMFGGELVYYRRLGSAVDYDKLILRFRA